MATTPTAASLAKQTADRLSQVWEGSAEGPSLRFPNYRSGGRRVSEQEARVLMCQELEAQKVPYAIEHPTSAMYSFAGTKELSARNDLMVFNGEEPFLAVEFKAGQPTAAAVSKDMQKLVYEQCPGLWFHTLSSANSATLPALQRKLKDGLVTGRAVRPTENNHELTVGIVVLQGPYRGLWMQSLTADGDLSDAAADWQRVDIGR